MTFISYAQNCEDVMLYRALRGVDRGFYVDAGAMDPVSDSVTKAFYERGWRGINVEPVQRWYDSLVLDRPEDVNLNLALLDKPGVMHLYEIAGTGLSTSDRVLAERHRNEKGYQIRDVAVTALTLDMVLEEHPHDDIHFLKVDVEGAERQVLEGIDLERTRPWIILVEATKPNSQEQDYDTWERLITDRGYTFEYFDGLNRFYLAEERPELRPAFGAPPNVFDCFIKASEQNIRTALDAKEGERQELQRALDAREVERQELQRALDAREVERQELQRALDAREVERQELQRALDVVYASKSWRVTLPLRKATDILRGHMGRGR